MSKLRAFWDLLRITFREWWDDNTFRLAASLSFYTIFSIAPILLIAIALAGMFFDRQSAIDHVVHQIQGMVGQQGGQAVRQVAESVSLTGGSFFATVFGIGTLVIGSTLVFFELQAALNQIWDVQVHPERGAIEGLLEDWARSFLLTLSVGFLLLVSLLLSAALAMGQEYLSGQFPAAPWGWRGIGLLSSFLIITCLFVLIYRFLPDVRIKYSDVLIGAVVTAVLFSLGKYAIGVYLGQAAMGSSYGAAGSFVVLLIWVYYSALICFYGAEFTQVYARRYGSKIRPKRHAVRVWRKSNRV